MTHYYACVTQNDIGYKILQLHSNSLIQATRLNLLEDIQDTACHPSKGHDGTAKIQQK